MARRTLVAFTVFLLWSIVGVTNGNAVPVCVTGPASSIASTSCSIGDKVFTFGAIAIQDDAGIGTFSADTILFTPNAADPLAPGFTLSGAVLQTATPANIAGSTGALRILNLGVATLSGLPTINGFTVSLNDAAVEVGQGALALANADLILAGTSAFASVSTAAGFGFMHRPGDFPTPISDTTANGFLLYAVGVQGGLADAVIRSASFFVTETGEPITATPEPATIVLFGSALVWLSSRRRRRLRERE